MTRMHANKLAYHYRRRGIGQPVVALHGFTGSSESWADLANDNFSQMEFVAIDLPGHGQTDSPPTPDRYAIEHAAEDIVTVAGQLGLECFSLLGYSMGGRLALYLAVHYPQRIKALVLESASPGIANTAERDQRREWDYALAERIEQGGIRAFVDRWEQFPLFASQTTVSQQKRVKMREQRLQNSPQGLANSLRGMGTGSQPSLWDALPALTTPTLLLCGELDQKYVQINRQMAAAMPNARLEIVRDAGHNIHFERPKDFATAVSSFLLQNNPG